MRDLDYARRLLGTFVKVKLDDQAVAIGRLLAVAEDGEITLVDSDGNVRWCWPMLDIEPSKSWRV